MSPLQPMRSQAMEGDNLSKMDGKGERQKNNIKMRSFVIEIVIAVSSADAHLRQGARLLLLENSEYVFFFKPNLNEKRLLFVELFQHWLDSVPLCESSSNCTSQVGQVHGRLSRLLIGSVAFDVVENAVIFFFCKKAH